jgi:hypothetical protein
MFTVLNDNISALIIMHPELQKVYNIRIIGRSHMLMWKFRQATEHRDGGFTRITADDSTTRHNIAKTVDQQLAKRKQHINLDVATRSNQFTLNCGQEMLTDMQTQVANRLHSVLIWKGKGSI